MTKSDLTTLIARNVPSFAELADEVRDLILAATVEQRLEQDEILAREGEPGDAMYLVVAGSLALDCASVARGTALLATVGPGELTGELSLITGHRRAATIRAHEPALVRTLHRAQFDELCAHHPTEMAGPLRWMAERLSRYQIATAMRESPLLCKLSEEARAKLEAGFVPMDLTAGETLFREGEPGDSLYLILSGRLRLSLSSGDGDAIAESSRESKGRLLTELGKGDIVGEMALLTGEPRSATAIAVRDSQLARLDSAAYHRIAAEHPAEVLGMFSRQLAARLRAQNQGRLPQGRAPVAVAVLSISGHAGHGHASTFAAELAGQLAAFGPTLHLNRNVLDQLFSVGRWGYASGEGRAPSTSEAAERRLLAWLGDQELNHRHVIYEADATPGAWTSRCLRQADLLLVVAEATADRAACADTLAQLMHAAPSIENRVLVLLHPVESLACGASGAACAPGQTRAWKQALGFSRHEHVRQGARQDVARVTRMLNGRAVGLTLGGGFALGLAHIGVIDAMRHLGIPIDYVGGTSMGAIIAAACAMHFTHAQMLEVMRKGCVEALKGDFTLPLLSLLTGRKVGVALSEYLAGLDIEDFWLPYFSISASLVNARMVVHREGDALRSVLASCRAPGMFPPIAWDGDVLVDGGLVNNIPADVMRQSVGNGIVIAADVSPEKEFLGGQEFGTHVSGWRVVYNNLNPFRKRRMGTMADVLMRLIRLGGVSHTQQIRSSADLYLSVPLQQFTFRDFSRGEDLAQAGYDCAMASFESWMAEHGRLWLGGAEAESAREAAGE
jgi:NTE family protein/lysophospholipid hydrolase